MTKNPGSLHRWLTLAANAAVLAGLLLLVLELRQNRDLERAQTRHELAMGIVDQMSGIAENPQLASVLRRGNAGEDLSPDELFQYQVRQRTLFRYWEDVHYQYRVGLYDEVEFASHREAWERYFVRATGAVPVWCSVREEFSPAFREELNGVLPTSACGP